MVMQQLAAMCYTSEKAYWKTICGPHTSVHHAAFQIESWSSAGVGVWQRPSTRSHIRPPCGAVLSVCGITFHFGWHVFPFFSTIWLHDLMLFPDHRHMEKNQPPFQTSGFPAQSSPRTCISKRQPGERYYCRFLDVEKIQSRSVESNISGQLGILHVMHCRELFQWNQRSSHSNRCVSFISFLCIWFFLLDASILFFSYVLIFLRQEVLPSRGWGCACEKVEAVSFLFPQSP